MDLFRRSQLQMLTHHLRLTPSLLLELQKNEQKQIINLDRVEVFERVRDLRFNNNQLYLFMENTASIGVINLN